MKKYLKIYKYRTMTDKKDENGELLPDKERLTEFGQLLRSTSVDELPEVFNVLKGDMSIVGPRPQLVRDMVFMNDKQRMRHTVKAWNIWARSKLWDEMLSLGKKK